ncbi:MAG: undecaprenyl/decaprenyl-phosphate alpha-N-acetylglucosaminyl 1-phosphate transferase [Ardenticatenales bacterium]|nr:undecaprenyl/decaprenyl-phosphate alpha-N-acetylglucosaminyl 1-phosphate transferase [Ardenticatenales bacterium]
MSTYLLIFFASLLLAIGGTPLVRLLALRAGIIDQPAARKVHTTPIPLLGGVAIYGAVCGGLFLFSDKFYITQVISIMLGATWVSFFGLWDDRVGLGAGFKLLAQLGGAIILIANGVMVTLPIPYAYNLLLTLLWIVGITNALNLLDNMDGLSSGIGAVAAAFFLLLAALSGQYLVGAMSAAMLGACLGFLLYNFNPASIFMGDTGSLFLGFTLASLAIKLRFPENISWVTWMIPLLVLIVPLMDTTLVFISRLRRGKNPLTTPGKDHLSHRLVSWGWSRREAVLLLYLIACAGGALAIFVSVADPLTAYSVAVAVLIAVTLLLLRFERNFQQP